MREILKLKVEWLSLFTLLLATVLMGCARGEPATPASPPAREESATPTSPPTAQEPFVVGWLTDVAGPTRDFYFAEYEGFNLYVQALNERGGVDGHPIKVMVSDISVDASKAVAEAKRLAQRQDVLMLLGLTIEGIQPGIYEEARKAQIPVIAGHSARPAMFPPADPLLFTLGKVFEIDSDAEALLTKDLLPPGSKVSCYIHEAPAASAVCDRRLDDYEEVSGIVRGKTVTAPIRTTDFTPYARELISENPDAIWIYTIAAHAVGVAIALRRGGYEGLVLASIPAEPEHLWDEVAASVGGENIWGVGELVSPRERGLKLPEMEKLKEAADKYGTEIPPGVAHVRGWVFGIAVEKALRECGFPCTRKRLAEIMSDNFAIDTKGLMGKDPIVWTKEDHVGCRFYLVYKYDPKTKEWIRLTKESLKFCPGDLLHPIK
jgi:ABC-type branched-subunit amino acid transport system substrate-binding protein